MNFISTKEGWPSRLELDGFVWADELQPVNLNDDTESAGCQKLQRNPEDQDCSDRKIESRIEYTFRWLLRRFVDPPWIDERLGLNSQPLEAEIPADS